MSDEIQQNNTGNGLSVEQITKEPISNPTKKKVKDTKKIAAGKKLVAYNKAAKEKKTLVKNHSSHSEDLAKKDESWLPETSITTIIAILGLGLTGIDLFS